MSLFQNCWFFVPLSSTVTLDIVDAAYKRQAYWTPSCCLREGEGHVITAWILRIGKVGCPNDDLLAEDSSNPRIFVVDPNSTHICELPPSSTGLWIRYYVLGSSNHLSLGSQVFTNDIPTSQISPIVLGHQFPSLPTMFFDDSFIHKSQIYTSLAPFANAPHQEWRESKSNLIIVAYHQHYWKNGPVLAIGVAVDSIVALFQGMWANFAKYTSCQRVTPSMVNRTLDAALQAIQRCTTEIQRDTTDMLNIILCVVAVHDSLSGHR